MTRHFNNIHAAYRSIFAEVFTSPQFHNKPRGQACREIRHFDFEVAAPSAEPIFLGIPWRDEVVAAYYAKECALYDSKTNRVQDFAEASKFWGQLGNPDGTVNSAYGFLIWANKSHGSPAFEKAEPSAWGPMRTPWEWAHESLIRDRDTRQAVLRFNLPEHAWIGVKDYTCTMHGIFYIQGNRLNFELVMRSQDVWRGLIYDMPWFCGLIPRMVSDLRPTYPDLEPGTYYHMSHSMHIYERDFEVATRLCNDLGAKPPRVVLAPASQFTPGVN